MKKVLLATSALVGLGGAASAEVSLSGYAEIGLIGGSGYTDSTMTTSDIETQFHHDLDVKFNLSGETDNGLTFGASIDLDEVGDDADNCSTDATTGHVSCGDSIDHMNQNGSKTEEHYVWVSGAFGTVTLGDTDGAFDKVMLETFVGTTLADDHSSHAGASGNSGMDGTYDGQILRYDYSFGDFAVAVSAELDDTGAGDPVMGIGFAWDGEFGGVDLDVGVGYQDNSVDDILGLSLRASFGGGFGGGFNYWEMDSGTEHTSVNIFYTANGLTVGANYGEFETAGVKTDGFGLVANYDLGGGAVIMAGYGSGDAPSGNGQGEDTFSLGLGLSF